MYLNVSMGSLRLYFYCYSTRFRITIFDLVISTWWSSSVYFAFSSKFPTNILPSGHVDLNQKTNTTDHNIEQLNSHIQVKIGECKLKYVCEWYQCSIKAILNEKLIGVIPIPCSVEIHQYNYKNHGYLFSPLPLPRCYREQPKIECFELIKLYVARIVNIFPYCMPTRQRYTAVK